MPPRPGPNICATLITVRFMACSHGAQARVTEYLVVTETDSGHRTSCWKSEFKKSIRSAPHGCVFHALRCDLSRCVHVYAWTYRDGTQRNAWLQEKQYNSFENTIFGLTYEYDAGAAREQEVGVGERGDDDGGIANGLHRANGHCRVDERHAGRKHLQHPATAHIGRRSEQSVLASLRAFGGCRG